MTVIPSDSCWWNFTGYWSSNTSRMYILAFFVMWPSGCERACALRKCLLLWCGTCVKVDVCMVGSLCDWMGWRGLWILTGCVWLGLQRPGPGPKPCWWIWRVGCYPCCRANRKCWSQVSHLLFQVNMFERSGTAQELDFRKLHIHSVLLWWSYKGVGKGHNAYSNVDEWSMLVVEDGLYCRCVVDSVSRAWSQAASCLLPTLS